MLSNKLYFHDLLKQWRQFRGLSQMELGLQADVSPKHISFLETGKAHPSKDMILQLAATLDLPSTECNALLNAAGFSENFQSRPLNHPDMQAVKEAIEHILDNHHPFPAAVINQQWDLLLSNKTHDTLMSMVKQLQPSFPETTNLLEMLSSPDGFRPFIKNWDEVMGFIVHRLRRESLRQPSPPDIIKSLLEYPDVAKFWENPHLATTPQPVLTLDLEVSGIQLSLFSTLSTFGTAIDTTLQSVVIEQYFPYDAQTESFFRQLSNSPNAS